jgi:hypothetical protein
MQRKEFTVEEGNNKEVKLCVRQPQYEDVEQADKIYASKVASLVRESVGRKLLLRSDLERFLKESGVWTDRDEAKVKELNKEIEGVLNQLRKGGLKVSELRKLCIDVMDRRKEIVQIMNKRQIFDDTTIESIAENERADYLVYSSTVYADSGDNYWDSFEDMKNDKFSDAYRKASTLAVELIYNVNPNFEKNLPENKLLRKYNLIDDELNYVDRKTGEKVDRNGIPVKQLEEEAVRQISNLQGDIQEEAPFIDDETNEPIAVEVKEEKEEKDISNKRKRKDKEAVPA